ncbi:SDR family oxidoreductase [Acinetobacter nectaris]|uniref:SDR family oxidoreductase n=1 Tax=Acinetobacter nectaris TaxID=1219382 RepID=UPI001F324020|nr:SDR family oxidoreductase [Acinetobacter nectaris]MCF9035358.1 SDR family oxidoreductase [Acinetobacter nectaris]
MDLGIKGKKALIIGGSKGLGLSVAKALFDEGVDVALISRDKSNIAKALIHIKQSNKAEAIGYIADLADLNSVMKAIDDIEKVFGHIDILLNNSGGPHSSGVIDIESNVWEKYFQSMILPIFKITDRLITGMRQRGWGRILTVASSTIIEPKPHLGISNTLRSSLSGWSKTLASEVAKDGVTVNLLLPGPISTDRTLFLDQVSADRKNCSIDIIKEERIKNIPAGRYGNPEEFGAVATFLASTHASYVTGTMLRIDGGLISSI